MKSIVSIDQKLCREHIKNKTKNNSDRLHRYLNKKVIERRDIRLDLLSPISNSLRKKNIEKETFDRHMAQC